MKFNSDNLLEEIIRKHLIEQKIRTDTNLARIGKKTAYGSIETGGQSPADTAFFNNIKKITKQGHSNNRPWMKLLSDVSKSNASELERIDAAKNLISKNASNLIGKHDRNSTPKDYSVIVSAPQEYKGNREKSAVTNYQQKGKLLYTIVYIKNQDIKDDVRPKWGKINNLKIYNFDQIDALKLSPAEEEEIKDKMQQTLDPSNKKPTDDASPEAVEKQVNNQFITKTSQLNNLGITGDSAKNLQRAMYTFGFKFNFEKPEDDIKNTNQWKNFVAASWNTSRARGDWDGDVGRRTRDLIEIFKAGFEVETDQDLYKKLQDAINKIQPNLTESRLYKISEQFNANAAKKKAKELSQSRGSASTQRSSSPRSTSKPWNCVLDVATEASSIYLKDGSEKQTSITSQWIKNNKQDITYIIFDQNNKKYTYYPDGTGIFGNNKNKQQYTCDHGVLKYFKSQVNKDDFDYQAKVAENANKDQNLVGTKSISRIIYDAAVFLKDFWAGKDLTKYINSWYKPFTGEGGFKLADWRDSWGYVFDGSIPDEEVVDDYDSAVSEMIGLLENQIEKMRNTEFYGMMDALYNISPGEIKQLKTLQKLRRDVTIQAGDEIFNQVYSDQFKYRIFELDENLEFSTETFDNKPRIRAKSVSIDYE